MQSGLFIEVLVLQSKRLMRILINPPGLFQTTLGGAFAVPQQIAMEVGHLARCADLVAVEVVGLLAAFAVGQFAVDQVAGAVVVIGRAMVGFKAVEYVVGKAVARTVFICDS